MTEEIFEKNRLREKREELEKILASLPEKKRPLEEKKGEILIKIEKIKKTELDPILAREREIELAKKEIEEKEKKAKEEEKFSIEKERWEIEKKRREIEKEKWKVEDKLVDLEKELEEIEKKYQSLLIEEERVKKEIQEIIRMEKGLELIEERNKLEKELKNQVIEKETFKEKLGKLDFELKEIERNLKEILESEKALEEEIEMLEEAEKKVTDILEKREIEKRRWRIEDERERTEKEKWEIEAKKREIENKMREIAFEIEKVEKREERILEKIRIIETYLKKEGFDLDKFKEKKETIEPEKIEPEMKEIPETEEIKVKTPTEKETEEEVMTYEKEMEKLEEVSEENILTFKKDVEKLKERESFSQKKTPEIKKVEIKEIPAKEDKKKLPEIEEKEKIQEEFRKNNIQERGEKLAAIKFKGKRLTFLQKILIRIGVITFLILIFGFFSWFLFFKKPLPETIPPIFVPSSTTTEEKVSEKEIEVKKEEDFLIKVEKELAFEVSLPKEITEKLITALEVEISKENFLGIIFKEKGNILPLKKIISALEIEIPNEILENLKEKYTLAIYSQELGKRIVLITQPKKDLSQEIKNFEKKIEKQGISLFGKKIPFLSSSFKTFSSKDITIRYLTISQADLGICYSFFEEYLIFGSSLESVLKTIERLKEKEIEKNLGQIFITSIKEKQFTLNLKEFLTKYRVGGILLEKENVETKNQLKELVSQIKEFSEKEIEIPIFIAVAEEGKNFSTIYFLEEKTSQAEIWNPQLGKEIAKKRAKELKELGINLNFAPLVEVANEKDFIYFRTFGKSIKETGEVAKAMVEGQKEEKILTAVKYFPGYSQIEFDPKEKLPILEKIPDLSHFKKIMEAKPEMVILSEVIYKELDPKLPFPLSPKGIQLTRKFLGNEILILSDDLDQKSLYEKYSLKEILKTALEAGNDILIFSGKNVEFEKAFNEVLKMIKEGEISKEKVFSLISKIKKFKKKTL